MSLPRRRRPYKLARASQTALKVGATASSAVFTGSDMVRLHLRTAPSRPPGASWALSADWRPCSTGRWPMDGNDSETDQIFWGSCSAKRPMAEPGEVLHLPSRAVCAGRCKVGRCPAWLLVAHPVRRDRRIHPERRARDHPFSLEEARSHSMAPPPCRRQSTEHGFLLRRSAHRIGVCNTRAVALAC
ncbi:unnamed protein product [Symbiodinium natans]|uniref:Uncharacterized protein n=1 Tax=Symbiodinium natans TaxID=878477 RepID=A0A812P6U7_9DINO|nr:unnamed protein product [Symbiodinium natans]